MRVSHAQCVRVERSAYVSASALESVALKATVVLPLLLLQKPSKSSKNKDHMACIERRMPLWREGDLFELLHEGMAIQIRKPKIHSNRFSKPSPARSFAEKRYNGRTKEALETLKGKEQGGVQQMNDQVPSTTGENQYVRDVLKEKHPESQPCNLDSLLNDDIPPSHSVVFDRIDGGNLVRTAALWSSGGLQVLLGLMLEIGRRCPHALTQPLDIFVRPLQELPSVCVLSMLTQPTWSPS